MFSSQAKDRKTLLMAPVSEMVQAAETGREMAPALEQMLEMAGSRAGSSSGVGSRASTGIGLRAAGDKIPTWLQYPEFF